MNVELLKELCEAPGIPGRESVVMAVIERHLAAFGCRRDALGNLIVTVCPPQKDKPHVLLEAHADRIGLMVTEILEDGFVRVTRAGGVDPTTMMGAELTIEGKNGPVAGIVGAPFPHPAKPHNSAPASSYKLPEVDAMFVDTGLADVKNQIRIGAPAVISSRMLPLLNGRVAAPALDNRVCCLALMELALQMKDNPPAAGVTLLFATREEISGKGARTAAFATQPDRAIVLDTAFASSPDTPAKDCSEMGKGPEIGVAALLDQALTEALMETAERENIAVQQTVFGRATGTDADDVSATARGIPTALLSIPIRYMHHPVETVDATDVDATVSLLCAYLGGI